MHRGVVITVLVENSVHRRGLLAEHGLAFHLQVGQDSLLFDTGQTDLILANARALGLDLAGLGGIALSHGHYDHTGGLPDVLQLAPHAMVFAHPQALGSHLARNPDGTTRSVGMPPLSLATLRDRSVPPGLSQSPREILPGIHLTGEIPRGNDFEEVGGPFVRDEEGTPDDLEDDQAMFFDTPTGLVVVLGCGHAGVINTLHYVRQLTDDRPVRAVLGGMHLLAAGPRRMQRTVEAFRELGIPQLAPAHCTGPAAVAQLWSQFACVPCSVGSRFEF